MASPDRQNQGRAVLYVAPGRPRNAGPQQAQTNPFVQAAPAAAQAAPAPAPFTAPNAGGAGINPPKDEFEKLLEEL